MSVVMLLILLLIKLCIWNRFGTCNIVLYEVKENILTDKVLNQDLSLFLSNTKEGNISSPDKLILYFVFSFIKYPREISGLR